MAAVQVAYVRMSENINRLARELPHQTDRLYLGFGLNGVIPDGCHTYYAMQRPIGYGLEVVAKLRISGATGEHLRNMASLEASISSMMPVRSITWTL
jgi:hypothetical protein